MAKATARLRRIGGGVTLKCDNNPLMMAGVIKPNEGMARQIEAIAARAWQQGRCVRELKKRDGALVARVQLEDGVNVIAKLWHRHGVGALVRRVTRTSNWHAEWRTLKCL